MPLRRFAAAILGMATAAWAQPVVTGVANVASFALSPLPQSGIAQGSMFTVFGSGLGPMLANWVAGHMAAQFHGDLRPVFLFAAVLGSLAGLLIFVRRHSLGSRASMMTVGKPASR